MDSKTCKTCAHWGFSQEERNRMISGMSRCRMLHTSSDGQILPIRAHGLIPNTSQAGTPDTFGCNRWMAFEPEVVSPVPARNVGFWKRLFLL